MSCNQPPTYNPCCDSAVPIREEGPPGIIGPSTVAPTPQAVAVDGPVSAAVEVLTGNVWRFTFGIPGSDLLETINSWTGQNTWTAAGYFLADFQVGNGVQNRMFRLYGGFWNDGIPQIISGQILSSLIGFLPDGTAVRVPNGIGLNAASSTGGIVPVLVTGNTPLSSIGPALNISVGAMTTVRMRATISFNAWTAGSGVTPFLFDVYVDGIKRTTSIRTNYEGFGEVNFYIDDLPAGNHSIQIFIEGNDPAATGSVEVNQYLLDARW